MQKDGFRLAYFEQLDDFDINDKEYNFTPKQKENIFEEILKNSNRHKVTYFEAHNILNFIISENNLINQSQTEPQQHQIPSQSQEEIQPENIENIIQTPSFVDNQQNNIYKRIKFELNKVIKFYKN
uniref:Uncharacterized protein n=1 Tax=Meloidogyne hapla TaxID=6305 RepID=A0A1I8BY77_MELHA